MGEDGFYRKCISITRRLPAFGLVTYWSFWGLDTSNTSNTNVQIMDAWDCCGVVVTGFSDQASGCIRKLHDWPLESLPFPGLIPALVYMFYYQPIVLIRFTFQNQWSLGKMSNLNGFLPTSAVRWQTQFITFTTDPLSPLVPPLVYDTDLKKSPRCKMLRVP